MEIPSSQVYASSLMVYRTGVVTSIISGRRGGEPHVHQTKPEVLSWKIAIVGIKNLRVLEENNNCRI
jgi:hypothetical protein